MKFNDIELTIDDPVAILRLNRPEKLNAFTYDTLREIRAAIDAAVPGDIITFAPGVTTQTITVPITNDAVFEGSETFDVNLSAAVNASIADNLGIGTIKDDGTGAGGVDIEL